jgi:AcrR family transcriptional regulator
MNALPSKTRRPGDAVKDRILHHARGEFFRTGYTRLTMAQLATDLGMSKKTLYVHFPGKDAIIAGIIDDLAIDLRRHADEMLGRSDLNFAEKLRGFIQGLIQRLSAVNPNSLRDLQRSAPLLHDQIEKVRAKNIPYVFGRFIAEGIKAGHVRPDVSSAVAVEFLLQAMQGLMQPAILGRLQLAPHEAVSQGIALFFNGLLSSTGRKHYDKVFPQ